MPTTSNITNLIAYYTDLAPWIDPNGQHIDFIPFDSSIDEQSITHAYAVPYISDHTCIITKRADGKWVLPGGTREAGETWPQTLDREIFEETGSRICRYHPFGAYRSRGDKTTFRVVCWADVEPIETPHDPDGERGISEIRFVFYADAPHYYTGKNTHFGAIYLLSHEIREQYNRTHTVVRA